MAQVLHRITLSLQRKWPAVLLACFWGGGLVFGITLFFLVGGSAASLLRLAASGTAPVDDLLIANLLPLLFSAFAVYLQKPGLLFGLAFIKGCLFSFVSMATMAAFGSAGWLIRLLLMFSDICLMILLYVYWLRHISGLRRFSALQTCGFAVAALLIGSIDHCYIAPFLVQLIEF